MSCSHRWLAVNGILHKGTLECNPWCSKHRQIDEAHISTPVAVDQSAANCLEEAERTWESSCKEQLPAPGNRSNERRYREKDLATTEEKKVGTGERTEKAGLVKSRHG
ncbi:hypothetical protein TNCV_151091 [Trichonephila clavipes]|uniref:Uncharacterized protein n=1 Tax=Trichonephila clavipes TaxID=2585209 RepID=A0A8X6V3K2_TRICX|nr:hypothetical protein TNCV_151091 [Trichonephila clavipes]